MWESGSGTRDSGGGGGRVGRAGGGGACRAAPGGAGRRAAGAADGVTGGTGLGRRGAVPCGTVLLPGTAGPLARALNARQAVSYGTSPGIPSPFPAWRGQAVPGRPAGAGHPGRGGGGAAGAGAPLSTGLPCPFWPPRALCCSWVCRRRSCRRGSAPRCEACKTAPEPSSSGHPAEKTFRLDARL